MIDKIVKFEYDSLRIGESGFREPHFQRLVQCNERHGNRYFVVGNRKIIFQNYVGVIRVGSLTIEILPKIGRMVQEKKDEWQKILIEMLQRSGELKLESFDKAYLKRKNCNIFDYYLKLFLSETEQILHRGLKKQYKKSQDNLHCLRGRLLFTEQLKRNLIHQERSFIEFQRLCYDNKLNRILKKALMIITHTSNSELSEQAELLLKSLGNVTEQEFSIADFQTIRFNRLTEYYREAIEIAALIILGYQPDFAAGTLNVATLLFDMNKLFEKYVAKELQRACRQQTIPSMIRTQYSKNFWSSLTEGHNKKIRPDIVIEQNGIRFLLDTKWKISPDRKPSDNDLKQMYAYHLQFAAKSVFLVYPGLGKTECYPGQFNASKKPEVHRELACGILHVEVIINGRLNNKWGHEILNYIFSDHDLPVNSQQF